MPIRILFPPFHSLFVRRPELQGAFAVATSSPLQTPSHTKTKYPSTSYIQIKATIAATFIFSQLVLFQLAKPALKLIIAFPSANKSMAL